jgi:hypothetical protein
MRHRLTPLVPALLFAFLAWGCESSPTDFYGLSGEITDERTGDGIGGATVSFTSDTGYGAETTANGDGVYRLEVETDHPFGQVRAEASGYVPKERTVYFDSADRRIDIALRPGGSM